jgi:hypothetical protein
MKQEDPENRGGSYGELCVFGEEAQFGISRMRQPDTVGEFPKQRSYVLYPAKFKELTRLRLNSPTVSSQPKGQTTVLRMSSWRAEGTRPTAP